MYNDCSTPYKDSSNHYSENNLIFNSIRSHNDTNKDKMLVEHITDGPHY